MNGKPVIGVSAKTIINFQSDFGPKLLCDGLTFSTGLSCAFSCSFCYVEAMMRKSPQFAAVKAQGMEFTDVVMRREKWQDTLRSQLMGYRGSNKYTPSDRRVIYSSPLVDVAANVELVKETIEACKMILELTPWHIRLLSKSNLLPMVAKGLGDAFNAEARVIYGVSTGTLDDKLAACFEVGTAKVSKRIESLHWLQDHGHRTFGMICPSLPQRDYKEFTESMVKALRIEHPMMEHTWAEVLNVRGESMTRTCKALRDAGYEWEASELERVSSGEAWEEYSRETFLGHIWRIPSKQLRFLQYVNKKNYAWWNDHRSSGAVLLGTYAKEMAGAA